MKKLFFCYGFFSCFFLISEQPSIIPTHFSKTSITILYRFYCVNRLTKMIDTLFELQNKLKKEGKIDAHFKKKYAQLEMLWRDFTAYKNLDDQDAVYTIIEYIFLLSQTLLSQDLIKQFSNINKNQLVQELDPHIEINEILFRFYYLKRLEPLINFLHILEHKKMVPFADISLADLSKLTLETTPVLYAINALQQDHTFEEFFILWDILNQYIYLKDTRIMSEYARALYYLFFITIRHLSHDSNTFYEQQKCVTIDQLQTMPLEDILNLLDIMVEELPYFLEKTELQSKLSWNEWFKKYWLVAPISAFILGIKVYMIYKGTLAHHEHHTTHQENMQSS